MLQEEGHLIKEQLAKPELEDFNASNGWLESFKKAHGIRKYWITGECEDVILVTVKTWLEKFPDILKDYETFYQWNMDELGLFYIFKKWKKSSEAHGYSRLCGSKSCSPVVIWQSQLPRCSRKLTVPTRPAVLHYFVNAKA